MENNKNKSVIELAMERVAREAARKALTSDPATSDALVQRQRKTDSTQTLRAEPATTELHSASPQRSEVQPSRSQNDAIPSALCDVDTHTTDRRFGFGSKTLVFAVTIPALIGIGAMMLMTQTARQNKLFLPPTKLVNVAAMASAPAASIPATATITVFPKTAQYEGESLARFLLERWRQAWTRRDIEAYLHCYSQNFVPADGQSRANWESARRKNLSSRSDISVNISKLNIERIADDQVKVFFVQDYASGTYQENARPKMLLMSRTGEDWKIISERQIARPAAVK